MEKQQAVKILSDGYVAMICTTSVVELKKSFDSIYKKGNNPGFIIIHATGKTKKDNNKWIKFLKENLKRSFSNKKKFLYNKYGKKITFLGKDIEIFSFKYYGKDMSYIEVYDGVEAPVYIGLNTKEYINAVKTTLFNNQ